MNFPLVSRIVGIVMVILTIAFAACLAISSLLDSEPQAELALKAFGGSIALTVAAAALFFWHGRRAEKRFFRKEALCVVGVSWLLASLIGAVPYLVMSPQAGLAGAIFESASGITTTGASVLSDLESLPPSLLFWRSLSQWIGGMGVVVFFVAILGFIGAGARILYTHEASGSLGETDESRIQSTVARVIWLYAGLSVACAVAFHAAGMNWFEAINHTFTTVSTGGFSTRSESMAAFGSGAIEWICIFFMIAGGTSFFVLLRFLRGRFSIHRSNTELVGYLGILAGATAIIAGALLIHGHHSAVEPAARAAAFQVVSIMTTTGFGSEDYTQWGSFPQIVLLFLMAIGGCSGSTSGGLKVTRVVVAMRLCAVSIERSFRSRVVRPIRMNRQALSEGAISDILHYLVLAGAVVGISFVVVALFETKLQVDTCLSMVLACFFNIGPGLAEVGPTENFALLHPHTKLYLAMLMVMGRLEMFAILALFAPSFWKRFK